MTTGYISSRTQEGEYVPNTQASLASVSGVETLERIPLFSILVPISRGQV